MNGELVDWADAKVHVGAHGLHYGSGVFEGPLLRHGEGAGRLPPLGPPRAPRAVGEGPSSTFDLPYSRTELRAATHELLASNGLASCYETDRLYGYGESASRPRGTPSRS